MLGRAENGRSVRSIYSTVPAFPTVHTDYDAGQGRAKQSRIGQSRAGQGRQRTTRTIKILFNDANTLTPARTSSSFKTKTSETLTDMALSVRVSFEMTSFYFV